MVWRCPFCDGYRPAWRVYCSRTCEEMAKELQRLRQVSEKAERIGRTSQINTETRVRLGQRRGRS